VLQERGGDSTAHALPNEDDAAPTVREGVPHCTLKVAPLRAAVLVTSRRICRDALVVAVLDRQARQMKVGGAPHRPQRLGTVRTEPAVGEDNPGVPAAGNEPGTEIARR